MKRIGKKQRVLLLILGVIILFAGSGSFILVKQFKKPSVLEQVATRATFPMFKPTYLPKGYIVDNESISLTSQALLFSAHNSQGDKLVFTETPVAKDFDFESFYKQQFTGVQDVNTIYGRAVTGILNDSAGGSLVTTSTWTLVVGPKDMPSNTMAEIVRNMKPLILTKNSNPTY